MDTKTIGAFIARLRREKGMTQKELAELLQVSDKTVSRWEREESLPDLSLVPALAEIFGVTVDELLRGERSASASTPVQDSGPQPGEKQLQRILSAAKTEYLMCCLGSITLSAAAILVVLACVNGIIFGHGIDRFSLAGALAGILQLLAFAHQTGGTIRAMTSLGEGLTQPSVVRLRRHLVKQAMLTYSIQLELTVFSFFCIGSWSLVEWLALGTLWFAGTALAALLICGIFWWALRRKYQF